MGRVVLAVLIIMIMLSFLPLRLTLKRCNGNRAGKVGTGHGREEEFALGIDVQALAKSTHDNFNSERALMNRSALVGT